MVTSPCPFYLAIFIVTEGISRPAGQPDTDSIINRIIHLRKQNLSIREIAAQVGVSKSTVGDI